MSQLFEKMMISSSTFQKHRKHKNDNSAPQILDKNQKYA